VRGRERERESDSEIVKWLHWILNTDRFDRPRFATEYKSIQYDQLIWNVEFVWSKHNNAAIRYVWTISHLWGESASLLLLHAFLAWRHVYNYRRPYNQNSENTTRQPRQRNNMSFSRISVFFCSVIYTISKLCSPITIGVGPRTRLFVCLCVRCLSSHAHKWETQRELDRQAEQFQRGKGTPMAVYSLVCLSVHHPLNRSESTVH